jgi:hypothetical protein
MNDLEDRLGAELVELSRRSPASRLTAADVLDRVQQRHRRRAATRAVVACAVVTAVVGGVVLIAGRDTDSTVADEPDVSLGTSTAPPLIALDVPGWRVERFDDSGQGDTRYAEYQLTNGTSNLQVSFYAGGNLEQRTGAEKREEIDFDGRLASLLDYAADGEPGRYRLDFVDGFWVWELNGDGFADRAAFLELASHVVVVDEATWEATLPPDAVTRDEQSAAVNDILVGIPLPTGFPAVSIETAASDPYQLTAQVTGAVFCAWLREWDVAIDTGDTVAAEAAEQAIASSHEWPVLTAMTGGDWNEVVWSFADRVASGDRSAVSQAAGGLGCAGSPIPATPVPATPLAVPTSAVG